ncbi:uncharacterized protein CC84DRAFT_1223533 [Paraphaeosphaeria sporulosa]|uniref:Uncharacterized protein n=1 Tax=Paraphaeosphaeria sporulosa TaxID=1460663 RepID=A0A177BVU5_9PLEO|nr:uncharacterized protein CC84DRAFT_1223533 [Paraphaeosphaeria sporulosa]OAF98788.1 hypothetical protein CC84DRAFT_1223533 [Paraphaeosphaeria sporulosa]
MPQTFHGCAERVGQEQAPLFSTENYQAQFARTYSVSEHHSSLPYDWNLWYYESRVLSAFDMDRFLKIRKNATLCEEGFLGNADLYGLGIRLGLYLQWMSSFLANNFLSSTRQEIQRVYLVFSLAICLATLIASTRKSCVFSVEIEILYWMYWGGYVCVFGSAPCSIRLGTVSRWVMTDWTGAILFTTHWIMTYHGIWFITWGYDQAFSRMPCGTYHFFLIPVLDPSVGFWVLRDLLTLTAAPWFPHLLTAFPLVALLLLPEAKHSMQGSAAYQLFLSKLGAPEHQRANSTISEPEPSIWRIIRSLIKRALGALRRFCALPTERRGGIRLVTPVDLKHRRLLRIRWATTGVLACILSVIAIELSLRWNRVLGVYSITSTGQYIPLIIGIASFISVCWDIIRQESERRRRLACHRAVGEMGEEYELRSLSNGISHAFAQPDEEFLMSGALPVSQDEAEADIADAGFLQQN